MPQPKTKVKKPACIKCKRPRDVVPSGDRAWFCGWCKIFFDITPGEDSTAYTDPTRRIQKQEEYEGRYGRRR